MENKNSITGARNDWITRIFDCLPVPTLVLKPSKVIVDANAYFLEDFGVDRQFIVGKTCHDFFFHSHEPCPLETCALAQVLEDRDAHSVLKCMRTEAGMEKWENRVFSPILDESGEVLYVVECIHDVTPIKILERELSGAKDFTEKLIQSSTTAIIAADMTGRILIMNPAAEELLGCSLKEAQGKITTKDLYPPGQAKEVMKILRDERMGGRGKLHLTSFTLISARGEEIPVDLTAAIIYEGNKEVATVGLFNDLREKLRHEQEGREMLVRVARAEKMASLGQLAAGVAHEINNPLGGILLISSRFMKKINEDSPLKEGLDIIVREAQRCKGIIQDLLEFSRDREPQKVRANIGEIIEKALGILKNEFQLRHILLEKHLCGEIPDLSLDANLMLQVFVNLFLNAMEAVQDSGTIVVSSEISPDGKTVKVHVQDTGYGIPEEIVDKLFDPFFSTKPKGTGLGLAVSYGIIQKHRGKILVYSKPGKGARFTVELPVRVEEVA